MHTRVLTLAFGAGLLLAANSAAAQTATPADPATPAATTTPAPAATPANNDDTVTCRYEKTTGSLFSRRICHTVREWRQMSTDAHDLMNNLDSGRTGGSGSGLGPGS
jgi:hypothetical protein